MNRKRIAYCATNIAFVMSLVTCRKATPGDHVDVNKITSLQELHTAINKLPSYQEPFYTAHQIEHHDRVISQWYSLTNENVFQLLCDTASEHRNEKRGGSDGSLAVDKGRKTRRNAFVVLSAVRWKTEDAQLIKRLDAFYENLVEVEPISMMSTFYAVDAYVRGEHTEKDRKRFTAAALRRALTLCYIGKNDYEDEYYSAKVIDKLIGQR